MLFFRKSSPPKETLVNNWIRKQVSPIRVGLENGLPLDSLDFFVLLNWLDGSLQVDQL